MILNRHGSDRNPAAQHSPAVLKCAILSIGGTGASSDTARIHHAAWRRGGGMADRSEGTATDEDTESWHCCRNPEIITAVGSFRTAHGRTRLSGRKEFFF